MHFSSLNRHEFVLIRLPGTQWIQKKSSKVYLESPRIRAVKFRRIRFGDGKQWKLLHSQNKTLLYSDDIKGYWCKEHKLGTPRIQAVKSHYRHKHNGAEITDKIEFEEVIVEKSEKGLPVKLQKQKEISSSYSVFLNLSSNNPQPLPLTPERKKLIDDIKKLDEEKWWVADVKKIKNEVEADIAKYEIYNRAKDAKMPKSKLEEIRLKLGIPPEETNDESSEMLKKYIIFKILTGQ